MAIQEQDTEFHDELEHEGEFSDDERVPETTSNKKAPKDTGKGTPSWRLIEDYKDRKRLKGELEDLDDLDMDLDEEN